MKTKIFFSGVLGFVLLLHASCIREELPVLPYDRGGAELHQISMGGDYQDQVWFSLSDGKIVSENKKLDWDLAFDCRADSLWIYLNSALIMQAAKTGRSELHEVSSTQGLVFRPDLSTGELDSNAIGRWWEHKEVLVIDRGYTPAGVHLGFIKLRVVQAGSESYQIEYAKLNGQDYQEVDIIRNNNQNRVMFNLDQGQIVDIEPDQSDWDLLFSTYTHQFYDPFLAYSVTGVLVQNGVQVALEEERTFDEISYTDLDSYQFSQDLDAIGYDWKEYDFGLAQFIIFPEKIYIIRDLKGFYYKLYFSDFYDEAGTKGTPTFVYQKL